MFGMFGMFGSVSTFHNNYEFIRHHQSDTLVHLNLSDFNIFAEVQRSPTRKSKCRLHLVAPCWKASPNTSNNALGGPSLVARAHLDGNDVPACERI